MYCIRQRVKKAPVALFGERMKQHKTRPLLNDFYVNVFVQTHLLILYLPTTNPLNHLPLCVYTDFKSY